MPRKSTPFVTIEFDGEFVAETEKAVQIAGPFGVPGSFEPAWLPKSMVRAIEYAVPQSDRTHRTDDFVLHRKIVKLRIAHFVAKDIGLI